MSPSWHVLPKLLRASSIIRKKWCQPRDKLHCWVYVSQDQCSVKRVCRRCFKTVSNATRLGAADLAGCPGTSQKWEHMIVFSERLHHHLKVGLIGHLPIVWCTRCFCWSQKTPSYLLSTCDLNFPRPRTTIANRLKSYKHLDTKQLTAFPRSMSWFPKDCTAEELLQHLYNDIHSKPPDN